MDEKANRTILDVRYAEKEQAKAAGAEWDKVAKVWHAGDGADLAALAKWLPQAKRPRNVDSVDPSQVDFYLDIPFDDKDGMRRAKAAGARFVSSKRCWAALKNGDKDLERWRVRPPEIAQAGGSLDSALRAAGLIIQFPIMDGKWRRAPVDGGKRGAKDGAYRIDDDGAQRAVIHNHLSGLKTTWSAGRADRDSMTPSHRAAWSAQIELSRLRREAEQAATYAAAAKESLADWESFREAASHPYLARKGIQPHGGRLDGRGGLVYDARDIDGKVTTIQTIQPDGSKKFKLNGKKMGSFHLMGDIRPGSMILVAEGIATGATLREATGLPVAVAFDAGNLAPVARALASRHPDSLLAIMADNDRFGLANTGVEKARDAASQIKGAAVVPEFPSTLAGKPTDWNDLSATLGVEEVARQVASGIRAERSRLRLDRVAELEARRPELAVSREDPVGTRTVGVASRMGSGFFALVDSDGRATVHEARRMKGQPVFGEDLEIQYGRGGLATLGAPRATAKPQEKASAPAM